jgi:hypothetical protein
MVLYVDDLNILVVIKVENTITCKTAYLLDQLEAWFNHNKLVLNIR